MITEIELENFQCHQKLTIPLGPITTLVGPNSAGKTAVVRALKWLATNQPSGMGFLSKQTPNGVCVSSLSMIDTSPTHGPVTNSTVTRLSRGRAKGDNYYKCGDQEYRAFGTGVPSEITKALNLHPCSFGGQLDAPFWLGLGGAELARELNAIVDLDIIDRITTASGRKAREAKALTTAMERLLKESEAQLKELEWVTGFDADLDRLEKLEARTGQQDADAKTLEKLISKYESREQSSEALATVIAELRTIHQARVRLEADSVSESALAVRIKRADGTSDSPIDLRELEAIRVEATRVAQLGVEVNTIRRQIEVIEACDRGMASNKQDITDLKLQLKKVVKLCPTCQQPLPSSSPTST